MVLTCRKNSQVVSIAGMKARNSSAHGNLATKFRTTSFQLLKLPSQKYEKRAPTVLARC